MRMRKLLWSVVALAFCTPLFAGQGALRDGHPDRYVVQKGDTLWGISKRFLSDAWLWPEIWYNNPDIKNPHLIYPGDAVSLVYVDGKARLTVQSGDRVGETARLSPGEGSLSPHVRETSLDQAIPTIPLEVIRPFLTESTVVGKDELTNAPYIVANEEGQVIGSAGGKAYARRLTDTEGSYSVLRVGRAYTDPDTKRVLGYQAQHLGDARLLAAGDPATLRLTKSNREILAGDKLVRRSDVAFESNFFPKAPSTEVKGRIIDVVDGVSQIGQYSVVVLNRGEQHGLAVGNVLAVYQTGRKVTDSYGGKRRAEVVVLPDELAGHLIVFRTFPEMSLGLIMEVTRPVHVMDGVRNP